MLKVVMSGKAQFNNRAEIANSKLKTLAKKVYYLIMTVLYSLCGYFAD